MKTLINLCAAFAIVIAPSQAYAARHIYAEVYYKHKVLLVGEWGDGGKADADTVWGYLKTIKFKPTDAFKNLKVNHAEKRVVLSGGGGSLADSKITVFISYGGKSKFRELSLVRIPKDEQDREWILDPKEVEDMFAYRLIGRRDAARLRYPEKLKTQKSEYITIFNK